MIARRSVIAAGSAALFLSAGATPALASTQRRVRPLIALTFDDGPSDLTPAVLKILARHRVTATFFMQGSSVEARPELALQVVRERHVVGNHSYSHPDFTQLTDEQADEEITRTNVAINAATGVTPVLFRYPFGNESAAGNLVIRREQMWGGVLWHWDKNDPGDFQCPGKRGVAQYITDNAVDQALILLHDGNDVLGCARNQIRYLDRAILSLKLRGYEFGVVAPANGPNAVNQQSWVQVVRPTR